MRQDLKQSIIPICVTIAGSDSGGGAGIQADLKAFSALHTYGASVITAVTAQNTTGVSAVHDIPAEIISAQIDAVFSDLSVSAVKIGMLSTPEIINAVAEGIEQFSGPVVLDPVMIAKSGNRLLSESAVSALIAKLIPLTTILTPNRPEAASLLGTHVAKTDDEAEEQGNALLKLGARAVLMKGGHADGAICTDILLQHNKPAIRISAPRIYTKNTHGTGCTLSAALAACLANSQNIEESFSHAHSYLHEAILSADQLHIGQGFGPVHHFHQMWS